MLTSPPDGGETVIPNPADYPDPLDHKLALAAGGCFQLPVDPVTKNPGSYAGKGWPLYSSREDWRIRQWHEADPDHAVAIHTGRSGLVGFDLDLDGEVIPDDWAWLRLGLFQTTRAPLLDAGVACVRGHYVFASGGLTFVSGWIRHNGVRIGEIRSGNTVLVTQPTIHIHADTKGGGYRWERWGTPPVLPAEGRAMLRLHPGETVRPDGGGHRVPVASSCAVTDEQVAAWLDAFDDEYLPQKLDAEVARFVHLVETGDENVHDAMVVVLTSALEKARREGSFGARRAERLLRAAWCTMTAAIAADHPDHDEAEFDKMLPWVIDRIESKLKHPRSSWRCAGSWRADRCADWPADRPADRPAERTYSGAQRQWTGY